MSIESFSNGAPCAAVTGAAMDTIEGLSPGQSLNADITVSESVPALLLPNAAFVNDSGAAWVYVVSKDGDRAERRTSKQVEVLTGLVAGDRVIVSS